MLAELFMIKKIFPNFVQFQKRENSYRIVLNQYLDTRILSDAPFGANKIYTNLSVTRTRWTIYSENNLFFLL